MINQSEDFIDGKLASFEIVLERLLKTARSGRERLSAQGLPTSLIEEEVTATKESFLAEAQSGFEAPSTHEETSFFDQDAY
jgi:hypothetical protein